MKEVSVKTETLSTSIREAVDQWLLKFPKEHRQSAILYALRMVQEEQQWISSGMMNAVADYLQVERSWVYEAATFYSMYQLEPAGKHKISICDSISCMLCASDTLFKHLESKYHVKAGETSADKKFYVKKVECLAACAGAPAVLIDDKHYHERVTPQKLDELIAHLE